jgi:hypothetical protein
LRLESVSVPPLPVTSYQTAPLVDYAVALRERAAELFRRVSERAGPARSRQYKGSFSILAQSSDATAAKIVVYQTGKGKINGTDPLLEDGVYVLIRVPSNAAGRTIGVAPKHDERFAYFRLAPDQNLDQMADFIATCAWAQ